MRRGRGARRGVYNKFFGPLRVTKLRRFSSTPGGGGPPGGGPTEEIKAVNISTLSGWLESDVTPSLDGTQAGGFIVVVPGTTFTTIPRYDHHNFGFRNATADLFNLNIYHDGDNTGSLRIRMRRGATSLMPVTVALETDFDPTKWYHIHVWADTLEGFWSIREQGVDTPISSGGQSIMWNGGIVSQSNNFFYAGDASLAWNNLDTPLGVVDMVLVTDPTVTLTDTQASTQPDLSDSSAPWVIHAWDGDPTSGVMADYAGSVALRVNGVLDTDWSEITGLYGYDQDGSPSGPGGGGPPGGGPPSGGTAALPTHTPPVPVWGVDYGLGVDNPYVAYIGSGTNDPGAGVRDATFTTQTLLRADVVANPANYAGSVVVMFDHAETHSVVFFEFGPGGNFNVGAVNSKITITSTHPTLRAPESNVRVAPSNIPSMPDIQRHDIGNRPVFDVLVGCKQEIYVTGLHIDHQITTITSLASFGQDRASNIGDLHTAGTYYAGNVHTSNQTTRAQTIRRWLFVNGANVVCINNYFDTVRAGNDSQNILIGQGMSGAGQLYRNNFFGCGSMGMMAGGVSPLFAAAIPYDITIEQNHFYNPPSYALLPGSEPDYLKNLFEMKNGGRVLFQDNLLENAWRGGQDGYGILIKSTNQDGDPDVGQHVTEDIIIRNNLIRNCNIGMQIQNVNGAPATGVRRVTFENNLMYKMGTRSDFAANIAAAARSIAIYPFAQDTEVAVNGGFGPDGLYIANITSDQGGNWSFYTDNQGQNMLGDAEFKNVIVTGDNFVWEPFTTQGFDGAIANSHVNSTIQVNSIAIVGATPGLNDSAPMINFQAPATEAAIQFVDQANRNYRLQATSPLSGTATDGGDFGVDVDALEARIGTPASPTYASTELTP